MKHLLLLLSLATFVAGCRKPLPSPDYIEASGKFSSLVAVKADDAFESPEMDGVVEQLGRVREKSSDYAAARALLEKISAERVRVAAEKVTAAKLMNPPPAPVNFPTLPPPVAPVAQPPPKPVEDPFAVVRGAAWEPIANKFIGCMVSVGTVNVRGVDTTVNRMTEGFELYDSANCRERLPTMVKSMVLVENGKIIQINARADVRVESRPAPGAPIPGAQAPVAPPAGTPGEEQPPAPVRGPPGAPGAGTPGAPPPPNQPAAVR